MQNPPESGKSEGRHETRPSDDQVARVIAAIDGLTAQIKRNHEENHTADQNKTDREKWTVRGILIYTGFTFIIAVVSIYQAHVFKETEIRQLRAYAEVGMLNVTCCSDSKAATNTVDEFRLPIVNNGQTPMQFLWAYIAHMEFTMTERFPDPFICRTQNMISERPHHADFITPKAARDSLFEINSDLAELIKDARDKKGWIMLCGRAIYEDIFGDKWDRRFCFMYKYSFIASEVGYCPDGNQEIAYRAMTRADLIQMRREETPALPEVLPHTLEYPKGAQPN